MMSYKNCIALLSIFCFASINAQTNKPDIQSNYSYLELGCSLGKTIPANNNFPETNPQRSFSIAIGKSNFTDTYGWANHLNYPKTGFIFSYTDYGNPTAVGQSISFMPFMDFSIFTKRTKSMSLQTGLGASYFNVLYNKETNPSNLGISTPFLWSFRAFIYYRFLQKKDYAIKIGAGFTHNSNGHIRLPNAGINSLLTTVTSEFYFHKKENPIVIDSLSSYNHNFTRNYFSTRLGFGQKVLSKYDNGTKDVVTFAFSFGKIKNKFYKYGVGLHYRFYEDYYDYIHESGKIITNQYPNYTNSPIQYASNIGIFTNFEVLMNHFSLETEIGINIYKPSYKIDWQINNEKTVNNVYKPAKFDLRYNLSHIFSTRLGLRYYILNTDKSPIRNLFLGATINANLGQADFSELNFGYVYSPKLKKK